MNDGPIDKAEPGIEDRRLQPDPQLQLTGGRASAAQIAITIGVSALIMFAVLYGINNQRVETVSTESGTTQQAAGAAGSGSNQPEGQPQGRAENRQQTKDNVAGAAPADAGGATTGSGERPRQPVPEPAKPGTGGAQR